MDYLVIEIGTGLVDGYYRGKDMAERSRNAVARCDLETLLSLLTSKAK